MARVPQDVVGRPFVGSRAVSKGIVTRAMLKGRSWRRLLPDVHIHAESCDAGDHRMWCDAAALILPTGAAIGGWSAACLWGVDLRPMGNAVWISLPIEVRMRRRSQFFLHRTPLPNADVDEIHGIPVVSPMRAAFDLGRRLKRQDALVAVDAMCHAGVSLDELRRFADTRAGWPGTVQLREVLSLAEPRTESPMESRARLVLADAGAPPLTAQYDVRTSDGRFIGRLDLAYPEWKIGIEYEGDHHRERVQFQRDVTRLNQMTEEGWLVLRFTADDVLRHPDRLIRQVSAAVRSRKNQPFRSTGTA